MNVKLCLDCGHDLCGLPVPRCPECGRVFDPADPSTFGNNLRAPRLPRWLKRGAVGALCVAVVLMMWSDEAIVTSAPWGMLGAVAIVGVALWCRHRLPLVALLVLNPYLWAFADGLRDYSTGRAVLEYSTCRDQARRYRLNPVYRCVRGQGGCCRAMSDPYSEACHDAAVKLATHAFGYMPGSYAGPYPTDEEAWAALAAGQVVDAAEIAADRVTVAGQTVRLDWRVQYSVAEDRDWEAFLWLGIRQGAAPPADIVATIFQKQCLILRVPQPHARTKAGQPPPALIMLIDLATGRPFTYLRDGDDCRLPQFGP